MLDNQVLARTSDSYVVQNSDFWEITKNCRHKLHRFTHVMRVLTEPWSIFGPKTLWKTHTKRKNWPTEPVLRFHKYPKNMPRVVFNEESKTGHGFKIGLRQQKRWCTPNVYITDGHLGVAFFLRNIWFCVAVYAPLNQILLVYWTNPVSLTSLPNPRFIHKHDFNCLTLEISVLPCWVKHYRNSFLRAGGGGLNNSCSSTVIVMRLQSWN